VDSHSGCICLLTLRPIAKGASRSGCAGARVCIWGTQGNEYSFDSFGESMPRRPGSISDGHYQLQPVSAIGWVLIRMAPRRIDPTCSRASISACRRRAATLLDLWVGLMITHLHTKFQLRSCTRSACGIFPTVSGLHSQQLSSDTNFENNNKYVLAGSIDELNMTLLPTFLS
jgi:hypothetical protein